MPVDVIQRRVAVQSQLMPLTGLQVAVGLPEEKAFQMSFNCDNFTYGSFAAPVVKFRYTAASVGANPVTAPSVSALYKVPLPLQ